MLLQVNNYCSKFCLVFLICLLCFWTLPCIVILCKSFDQSLFEKKLLHTSPKSTSQDFHTVSLVLSLLIIWKVCVHMSRYLIVFILLPLFYFRQMTSGYLSKLSTKTREDITLYPLLTEIILRKSRLVVDFLSRSVELLLG